KKGAESDFDTFRRTQATLVKSRLVLNAALKMPAVVQLPAIKRQPNPLAWLEKSLQVDFPNNGEILRIGLTGPAPEELVPVVDAVAGAYLQQIDPGSPLQRRLERLTQFHDNIKGTLAQRRHILAKLEAELGIDISPTSSVRHQHLVQELTDCTRELRRVKLAKVAARVRLSRHQAPKQT